LRKKGTKNERKRGNQKKETEKGKTKKSVLLLGRGENDRKRYD
jgi:hypothetical protein